MSENVNSAEFLVSAVAELEPEELAGVRGRATELDSQRELLAWVGELMVEEDVRALPRDTSAVGRRLDGRGFWYYMGIWPTQGRIR